MDVGYLPDMFGHVAQMPQLLRLAGLRARRRVARGARGDRPHRVLVGRTRRIAVRAEYLYGSYSNGRDLPPTTPASSAAARGYEAELGPALLPGGGLLLMNGTDHQLPQPGLGQMSSPRRNATQDDYHFAITSLPEYLASSRSPDDLAGVDGASCAPGRARTCSWAWRRTASTCTRLCARRACCSSAARSR